MLRNLGAGVVELLAPERCLSCRRRSALPWCGDCAHDVRSLEPSCRRCGGPRVHGHACWPRDVPFEETIAAFDYRGAVARTVVTAKFAGATRGWIPMAQELARRVEQRGPDIDVVSWVTTPRSRALSRGGDHARLLAAEVARRLDLPLEQLLNAIPGRHGPDRYTARVWLPGTNIGLVDDIMTTGATALRAGWVLRDAGAGRLVLAVLARAGNHPLTGGHASGENPSSATAQ